MTDLEDWDNLPPSFVKFLEREKFNWKEAVRFWRNRDVRRNFLHTISDADFAAFDDCLMQHEVPGWKQSIIFTFSPMFHQGNEAAHKGYVFLQPMPYELWFGWFCVVVSLNDFPTHPSLMWNKVKIPAHFVYGDSTKKH